MFNTNSIIHEDELQQLNGLGFAYLARLDRLEREFAAVEQDHFIHSILVDSLDPREGRNIDARFQLNACLIRLERRMEQIADEADEIRRYYDDADLFYHYLSA